jgi:hypothetical protein
MNDDKKTGQNDLSFLPHLNEHNLKPVSDLRVLKSQINDLQKIILQNA